MKYSGIQHRKNKKRNLYIIISVVIYFSYRFMFCYDITYPLYIQSDHFLDYSALFKPLMVNPFKLRLLHEQLKEYSDFDKQKLKFDSQYHERLKFKCKIAQLALKNGFEIEGIEEKDDVIGILISIPNTRRLRLIEIEKSTDKIIGIRLG